MASTKANRKAFITSLGKFLEKWPFTAVELHWQWYENPMYKLHVRHTLTSYTHI
jgi:hypothetical protein